MAIELNGTQYLTASFPVGEDSFAFSGWFYRDLATFATLFAAGGTDGYRLNVQAGGAIECVMIVAGTPTTAVTTTTIGTGLWFHVLGVFDRLKRTVWLNGGGEGSTAEFQGFPDVFTMSLGSRFGNDNLDGRLAETAIWSGSDAASMDITDAGILATGYSPLCVTRLLKVVAFYQPLVRDLNWSSQGPAASSVGSPSPIAHPRTIYPGHEDNLLRSPGSTGTRVTPHGFMPLSLNLEK